MWRSRRKRGTNDANRDTHSNGRLSLSEVTDADIHEHAYNRKGNDSFDVTGDLPFTASPGR